VTPLFRSWETDGLPATVTDPFGVRHVVVTRHAQVRAVLADPVTFRPDNALDAISPMPVGALRILAAHGFRLPPTLANNGGVSHPAIRAAVAEALHPARVAAQRPWLAGVVGARLARLGAVLDQGGTVDLYADLAADLPLLVLSRLVDLPAADTAVVKEFTRAALELFWAPVSGDRQQHLAAVVGRFHAVLRAFAADGPGLAATLRDGGRTLDEVVGALFFLLVAGQETTSQFLTLLMYRLAVTPPPRDAAVDDVVEEALRLDPPIVTWRRVAARNTVLGGLPVAAGTSVVLWLAGAGRDPAVVASPDAFVPGQPGSRRHLAFGAGAHRCVGAQLSRMEAAVIVEATAGLLRGVEVVRAPWCPDNLSFRMPDSFTVSF
jgi:cytochrome P450